MTGLFWGSRRSCKTPHCHHHYQFHHHCLYCPPCRHCKKWKTLAEIIVHECNRVPPRSCVKKNHPHDVGQWSRELLGLEPQPRIRSWADLGGRRCYFEKSKHLHRPHHQLIIHLPSPCLKGKSNGRERWAAVDDGGVRIKGVGTLRQLATLHDVGQWSSKLVGLKLQPARIRSWADLGCIRWYVVKLKHLHCPHHWFIIHLPRPCGKGKSNGWERWAAVNDVKSGSRMPVHCGSWRIWQLTKSGKTSK